jgi:hypothetical protein
MSNNRFSPESLEEQPIRIDIPAEMIREYISKKSINIDEVVALYKDLKKSNGSIPVLSLSSVGVKN